MAQIDNVNVPWIDIVTKRNVKLGRYVIRVDRITVQRLDGAVKSARILPGVDNVAQARSILSEQLAWSI